MQLVIGRIGRPHGLRGDVSVEVRTDDPEGRFAPGTAVATDPASTGPLVVESRRWHSGVLLVRFEGVNDRDRAEALRGTTLVIDSADIPPSEDPDEFYDHQLIGLAVVTPDGERVGEVTDVLHHGQDLLVVRRGTAEVYVPFVKALVPVIDLDKGLLVVDGPAGLLDPDQAV
ncbi:MULTISPECIES: ribosome maturation factor RimM [Streptosporangium]|uniref:Ribosome maturation factor RimM n=1 Tax=Streptosporangium brasiliense TaxID=47480 RepID=A0ABT9QVB2_9ACTN|nr:ribosome maturation factor RimM [Streptosporangium brasiliense]MDP9860928.1 16S rRNA processing protein RimM [Streptosporangium brasiliense]